MYFAGLDSLTVFPFFGMGCSGCLEFGSLDSFDCFESFEMRCYGCFDSFKSLIRCSVLGVWTVLMVVF